MVRFWSEEEINFLKEYYPIIGKKNCCIILNRSEGSIRKKTFCLKIKQNKESDFFKDWQKRAAQSKIGRKRPEQAKVILNLHASGKLKCTEQKRQKLSINAKEYIRLNGHPKGMLGKKHTEEIKKILSKKSKILWKNPDFIGHSELHKQKKSDAMSLRHREGKLRQGYSRGKQGKREDLNNVYFRSSWEANYARYLNLLKSKGEIYEWQFEPDTFWFEKIKRGVRSYLPDFKIWHKKDAEPYYIEVKGWMDDKSKTKLKRMKKYYPNIRIDLVQKKEYNEIKNKLKHLIPQWE